MKTLYLLILLLCVICSEFSTVCGQNVIVRLDQIRCSRRCSRLSKSRAAGCCDLYKICCNSSQ
ncbi:unnamed protein product [Larinioides sclopetarius]|uniref:Uncharacterized protein n=1 Tax=Larinioides sclopetarius TaxID=280406 RepID=A0AAV2BXB4_9ARAC